MSEPFLGEIKLMPWYWAPKGWHLCDGTLLPIQQNTALFSLLGTHYGGNGTTTFGLPDLRGRTPIHFNNFYPQGTMTGSETVTLLASNLPVHTHGLEGQNVAGAKASPIGNSLANTTGATPLPNHYATDATTTVLNPASVQQAGGGQPHNNLQPFLTLNYCIALMGIFPTRN